MLWGADMHRTVLAVSTGPLALTHQGEAHRTVSNHTIVTSQREQIHTPVIVLTQFSFH